MKNILKQISNCKKCEKYLDFGVNPILSASAKSKIIIIGQAPGRFVHETGIPWNDKSGDNLRNWLGIDQSTFYNTDIFSIIPMAFCYPGKGKSGDLPPRPECAPLWHSGLLSNMPDTKLILLIGRYAQDYYLGNKSKKTLTETIRNFKTYLPDYFVLPHPSPRNNIWQSKNKWFASEVLPELRKEVNKIIN